MSKLKLPSKITEYILEDFLKELNASPEEIDLELPVNIKYTGFGILPSLFLVIFSWIRHKKGKLIIPIDIKDENTLSSFALDYYGYLVLSTVWRHCLIVNHEDIVLKGCFRKHTNLMYERIDFFQDLPNERILIPCFDHYPKHKGLSHWFYTTSYDFVDSPSAFHTLIHRILDTLAVNFRKKILGNNAPITDDLQKILWELIGNTNEHALKDPISDIVLTPNSRAVLIRIVSSSKNNFIEAAKENQGLVNYYNSALTDGINYIMEISVFDSGPGLVKRFLGKNWSPQITMDNEVDTIKRCLIKGQTSIVGTNKKNKGYGLNDVLELLGKKNGFLKIRSGKASVYRDLIASKYINAKTPDEVDLYDWSTSRKNSFDAMQYIEGTVITLAYPINNHSI